MFLQFFLHAKDTMDLEEFVTTGWVIAKPYYTRTVHTVCIDHEMFTSLISD